ncbi:PIN domain-containing protein [Tistrella mobilis]|uniref:PIN domain-containing protein n=1 Tax=Tistrella mobilis TaxID=171437 RepID=UPI003558DADC
MPHLSDDEIKTLIAEGGVFAISIDTAVFDGKQKTFQNAVLRRLDQFHVRDISVIIVDVVAEEMKSHLRDEAADTQRALKKALRAHTNRWGRETTEGEEAGLLLDSKAADFAQAEFDAFLAHIHGEVISVGDTPDAAQQVFRRYFAEEPPFGSADKRKSEFPDAFALLRLDAYAAEEGKALICVSPDRGWIEYAAQSDHLICVGRLEDALALFNAADQHLADAIVERWRQSEGGGLIEDVSRALEYRLDDLDFHIEGHADVSFEAEPLSAVLQYVSPQNIGQPTIIAVDGETVTFTVRVEAVVGFEASFSFYVTDSIDRDEVSLGSEEAYVEKTLPFELTITADRSLEDGPVFHEVEVAKKRFEVDFGYVEAFPNEDPTHEKY